MSRQQLQRALRATARIAGVGLALGCAPTLAEVDPTPSVYSDVGDLDTDTSADDEPAECADLLDDLVVAQQDGDFSEADRPTRACCEDVIDAIRTVDDWPVEPEEQAIHWACCAALDYPAGLACSPWGPPSPPAMVDLRPVARHPDASHREVA